MTIRLLQHLGWIINYEKSELEPSQDFQLIGMLFKTQQFTVVPLPKMRLKVQSVNQHWIANPNNSTRDLHRLLGMLVFMATLVPRGRLHLWPVQWWASTFWCQRTGNWSDRIQVPQWVLSEVAWWSSPAVLQGLALAIQETEVTLFTDVSSTGWGAQLRSHSAWWRWSYHINVLEMQAVINAVRAFLPHLRPQVVHLMCDNATAVAYIRKERGTRLYTLMQLSMRLIKWCDLRAIRLVPFHLLGIRNIQEDSLSRVGQTLSTEWAMAMERLLPVFARWGQPQVDLFDTYTDRLLLNFVSPYPNHRALFKDAISAPWTGMGFLYVFPPFKLIPQVLHKLSHSPGVQMILIVPLQKQPLGIPSSDG